MDFAPLHVNVYYVGRICLLLLLRLSERALCAQLTSGHVFLVALTTIVELVVLLVLVCGTVCHNKFDSQTFCLLALELN